MSIAVKTDTGWQVLGVGSSGGDGIAYGGILVETTSYRYHVFSLAGTSSIESSGSLDCQALVVGAGGAGADNVRGGGGGGGAGAILPWTSVRLENGANTVFVGDAGRDNNSGESSFISSVIAEGGGAGGTTNQDGKDGGCGGGGGQRNENANSNAGGVGSVGFDGGRSMNGASLRTAGGGGGMGSAGQDALNHKGGDGGTGLSVTSLFTTPDDIQFLSLTNVFDGMTNIGSGGGGGGNNIGGQAGGAASGGGGAGSKTNGFAASSFGSGGGGGGYEPADGGAGYRGLVIVKYPLSSTTKEIVDFVLANESHFR